MVSLYYLPIHKLNLFIHTMHLIDIVVIVEDSDVTPVKVKPDWWLESLHLASSDKKRLLTGMELTDSLMNAVQKMLQDQFPNCQSLQDVTLGQLLMFAPVSQGDGPAVQILHTGE